jgi:hypothetical protein
MLYSGAEMVPIEHETRDRVIRIVVFVLPPTALCAAGWLAWGGTLHWQDLLVLALFYTLTGTGVVAGLAIPFGFGVALTGAVGGGLTGLLWGGAVPKLDPGARVIAALERSHLAWDAIRISAARQRVKFGCSLPTRPRDRG